MCSRTRWMQASHRPTLEASKTAPQARGRIRSQYKKYLSVKACLFESLLGSGGENTTTNEERRLSENPTDWRIATEFQRCNLGHKKLGYQYLWIDRFCITQKSLSSSYLVRYRFYLWVCQDLLFYRRQNLLEYGSLNYTRKPTRELTSPQTSVDEDKYLVLVREENLSGDYDEFFMWYRDEAALPTSSQIWLLLIQPNCHSRETISRCR